MQLLKKYGLLTLTIVLFLLLLLFPPIYLYEFYPYGISGYTGFILGFLIPVGIRRAFYPVNRKRKPSHNTFFVLGIIFSIAFMCLFTALLCGYKTYTLFRTTGILVQDALIINGKQLEQQNEGSKSDSYEIELSYKLKDGTMHHLHTPVEADIFEHVFKKQKVDILYLPDNLDMVRLLVRNNVNTYLNRPNDLIMATDIDSIFNCDETRLLKLLNGLSYRWHTEIEDEQTVYSNHITLEKVAKVPYGLGYTCLGEIYGEEYLEPLKIVGKPTESEDHSEVYLTEKYRVTLKRFHEDGTAFSLLLFEKRYDSDLKKEIKI